MGNEKQETATVDLKNRKVEITGPHTTILLLVFIIVGMGYYIAKNELGKVHDAHAMMIKAQQDSLEQTRDLVREIKSLIRWRIHQESKDEIK